MFAFLRSGLFPLPSEGKETRIAFNYPVTQGGLHFSMPVSYWMLSELLSWKLLFACWWALQILLQSCLSCQDNIKHSKTSPYVLPFAPPCAPQIVLFFSATRSVYFLSDECVCVCTRARLCTQVCVCVHSVILQWGETHCLHSRCSFLAKKNSCICCFVHRVLILINNCSSDLLRSLDTEILISEQMRDYLPPFFPVD